MSTNAIVFEWPRHWRVWGKLDITAFFRAVEPLLPANSPLYIEGTSIEHWLNVLKRSAQICAVAGDQTVED